MRQCFSREDERARQALGRHKIMTLGEVAELIGSSIHTARRRLQQWQAANSYNRNGRYYTLPEVPEFDGNGLWRWRGVFFSQYGNLKQTLIALVHPTVEFRPERTHCCGCGAKLTVHKTRTRTVSTLQVGPFRAREVFLRCVPCRQTVRSQELGALVPPGANFGYDVMVHVGQALFLRYRNELEVVAELAQRNIQISPREVSWLAMRFVESLAKPPSTRRLTACVARGFVRASIDRIIWDRIMESEGPEGRIIAVGGGNPLPPWWVDSLAYGSIGKSLGHAMKALPMRLVRSGRAEQG